MRRTHLVGGVLVVAFSGLCGTAARAEIPTLDAFFAGAQIRSVSISPDGQSLAMIVTADNKNFVAVKERNSAKPATPILAPNERDGFEPSWCRWANNERVVCSFRGREHSKELAKVFPVTRLVSVNRDGSKQKMLLQDQFPPSGQINDRIIDWTPEDHPRPSSSRSSIHSSACACSSSTSTTATRIPTSQPYRVHRQFRHRRTRQRASGLGPVRPQGATSTRGSKGEKKWRELARVGVFDRGDEAFDARSLSSRALTTPTPCAITDGRAALWKIDLTDKEDPQLVFASSRVDVTSGLYAGQPRARRAAGFRAARMLSTSSQAPSCSVRCSANCSRIKRVRHRRHERGSQDRDRGPLESDSQAPEFQVLDMSGPADEAAANRLTLPGSRQSSQLARTEHLTYPARDGTPIPAFLTRPVGVGSKLPPLIILPHGGPWARDAWGFDSWVQMLVRDGYAVLQMNYRGSGGYGKQVARGFVCRIGVACRTPTPSMVSSGPSRRSMAIRRASVWSAAVSAVILRSRPRCATAR